MNNKKTFLVFVTGILCGVASIKCFATTVPTNSLSKETQNIVRLKKIVDTVNLVDKIWVGEKEISEDKLYEGAISGVLKTLDDPYSEYLDKESLKEFSEDLDGVYSGVGLSIRKEKGQYLEVISPFIGSPAFKANIQIGDRIVKIDGKDIKDNTATETSKMLRGKKGTKVEVEIQRKGLKKNLNITLVRDDIKLEKVEYKMIDDNIGYISLLQFGNGISDEISKALDDLNAKGMKKLILDLRTNPGGSLNEAIDLTSLFIKEDLIVSLKEKSGNEKKYNRTNAQKFKGDMVVLVNEGSASASEIITGALKDYKRATIIGDKTYGKGVVQTIYEFKTGDAIKLTIAKYFTPNKVDINKKGIEPDIYIETDPLLSVKGYGNETEQAKTNRLNELKKIMEEVDGKEKAEQKIKQGDRQLKAAIDHLNGLKVKPDVKEEKK